MKAFIPRVFWLFPSSCWLEQLKDLDQNMDECSGERCFSQIILITSSKFRDREGSPFCTLFMMPSIQSSKTEIWVYLMPATREQPKWHPVLRRASGDKLSNGHLCKKRQLLYSVWYFHKNSLLCVWWFSLKFTTDWCYQDHLPLRQTSLPH